MCNPIEEKTKQQVINSLMMTSPAGAWAFRVKFVFSGVLAPLNKYAEDLSECVSEIQPPMILPGFKDIMGHIHINFQERENHFVTKFFNTLERLTPTSEAKRKKAVLVTLQHLENNSEKIIASDVWQCEPGNVQIAPYSYKDKDPDGIKIAWELDVNYHTGDELNVSDDSEKSK